MLLAATVAAVVWVNIDAGSYGSAISQDLRALRVHAGAARIAEDVDSADLSGVSGTPTFFVNGRRHHGA